MERDEMKSQPLTAVGCAKAAMLLRSLESRKQNQEKEVMQDAIENLKMELVKERFKRRNLKVWNLFEFSVMIVSLFSLTTLVVLLGFKLI